MQAQVHTPSNLVTCIGSIVAISLTCLIACQRQADGPKFIDSPGVFNYFSDKLRIEVSPNEGGKLKYQISNDKISTGPSEAAINQNQPWFIFPESEASVWVFNGSNDLTHIEISSNGGTKFTSSLVVTNLPQRAPKEVRARLPQ